MNDVDCPLTTREIAGLLAWDPERVNAAAELEELPGALLGGEWRFSEAGAVLRCGR